MVGVTGVSLSRTPRGSPPICPRSWGLRSPSSSPWSTWYASPHRRAEPLAHCRIHQAHVQGHEAHEAHGRAHSGSFCWPVAPMNV